MFLIKCDHDDSLTIVENDQVTYDKNKISPGTKVSFLFRKKSYEGIIELYSDSEKDLDQRLKELEDERKRKRSLDSIEILPVKRRKTVAKPWSPAKKSHKKSQETNSKRDKKLNKHHQSNLDTEETLDETISSIDASDTEGHSTSDDVDNSLDDSQDTSLEKQKKIKQKKLDLSTQKQKKNKETVSSSPTKEELKKIIASYQKIKDEEDDSKPSTVHKKNLKAKEKNSLTMKEQSTSLDAEDKFASLDLSPADLLLIDKDQMFGADFDGAKMIPLGQSKVYCRKDEYDYSTKTSSGTSKARRLIEGVFTNETLLNSTLSGKAKSKEDNRNSLNNYALETIIGFAIANSTKDRNVDKIKQALRQKLTEMRRTVKLNATVMNTDT